MPDKNLMRQRTRETQHLQVIAGNPFDAEDHALLAELERRGLSPGDQETEIIALARRAASGP